jgi:hypothetical protein
MKPVVVAAGIGSTLALALVAGIVVGGNFVTSTGPSAPPVPDVVVSEGPAPESEPEEQETEAVEELDPEAPPVPEPSALPASGIAAQVSRISKTQWNEIVATGTWRPECPAGRKDLRRIDLNYRTFEGEVARGQLVANADSVDDLVEIFTELFEAGFPIARMEPVEKYGGDVLLSLQANNTSAFNCRKPGQINAPVTESPHANGRAIDINPVQNPWRDPRCECWQPSKEFAKTKEGPGIIRKGSLPVDLFEARGWVWQNIKVPDYMHFDTGYPSRPRTNS